jgi:hypothetical protein
MEILPDPVFDVLVERYENFKFLLSQDEQLAVCDATPTHLDDRANFVPVECRSNTWVDAFV